MSNFEASVPGTGRVLQIIPTYKPAFGYGGPVMSVSRLCESLTAKGVPLQLITTNGNGKDNLDIADGYETVVDGVDVIYFNRTARDPFVNSPTLWRFLREHADRYDVVHIHSWWNFLAVLSARICVRKGLKVIVSPRGMLSDYVLRSRNALPKRIMHALFGRRILARTWYHATSEQEDEECKRLIHGWKGFTIPNLLALPSIPVVSPSSPVFTFGFLSRVDPKKGLELFFRALTLLDFPFRVQIAGTGDEDYLRSLAALAFSLGLSDRIEWLGWKGPGEKFALLNSWDLLVLTSYNENFANVVVESLHMGTPVCISREVALSAFVERSGMGWVTGLTEENIAATLTSAYQDAATRAHIRENGRRCIAAYFSEETLSDRYIDMYKSVHLS